MSQYYFNFLVQKMQWPPSLICNKSFNVTKMYLVKILKILHKKMFSLLSYSRIYIFSTLFFFLTFNFYVHRYCFCCCNNTADVNPSFCLHITIVLAIVKRTINIADTVALNIIKASSHRWWYNWNRITVNSIIPVNGVQHGDDPPVCIAAGFSPIEKKIK